MSTVYKVVRRTIISEQPLTERLASVTARPPWRRSYVPGKSHTGLNGTPLFAFSSPEAAQEYVEKDCRPVGLEVWECEAENVLPAPRFCLTQSAWKEFWEHNPGCRSLHLPPKGTVIADSLTLTKRVWALGIQVE